MGVGETRLQLGRAAMRCERSVDVPRLLERLTEVVVRGGEGGPQGDRPTQTLDGLGDSPGEQARDAEVREDRRAVRGELRGPHQRSDGLLELPGLEVALGQAHEAVDLRARGKLPAHRA